MITGTLIIPADTPAFDKGTAYISLEDISHADALSRTLAEVSISGISHLRTGDDTLVPFAVRAPAGELEISPRADYAIDAWLDCNSDGRLSKGDLAGDEVYRVLTRGFGSSVSIKLRQI